MSVQLMSTRMLEPINERGKQRAFRMGLSLRAEVKRLKRQERAACVAHHEPQLVAAGPVAGVAGGQGLEEGWRGRL